MALATAPQRKLNTGSHMSKAHAMQLQRILKDEKNSEQEQLVKNDVKASLNASWTESLDKTSQRSLKKKNEEIKREVQLANKALTAVRRAQLRQLLEEEHSQFEHELHSLGLAFHKERL